MAMYVWLCMYGYVCMAMYVWLCMYGYVCMAMYVWLCMYGCVCMAVYVWLCMYGYVCIALYVWLCMYGYVWLCGYMQLCICGIYVCMHLFTNVGILKIFSVLRKESFIEDSFSCLQILAAVGKFSGIVSKSRTQLFVFSNLTMFLVRKTIRYFTPLTRANFFKVLVRFFSTKFSSVFQQ